MGEKFIIQVVIDPKRAVPGAKKVRGELDRMESGAKRLRTELKSAFGILAAGALLSSATRTLASFSQEMSTVAAVANATGAEFEALQAKAIALGTNTRFTATQAAEGMTFLARAGFDADQVLTSIGDTLNLAQSGSLGLGEAADIASNALTSFRLGVDETARVVDVLSLAANSSNTTVAQLADGLKLVAPIAAGVGVEIEETAAAISALSNAGLQATLAGTGLRRVISELESPSSKTLAALGALGLSADEFKVSSVGLTGALKALADAGVDTGLGLELFGDRGGPAFQVLRTSITDVESMTSALNAADGTAARIAATMDDNLNGSILALKSSIEGLVLAAGESGATSVLRALFDVTTEGFRGMANNIELVSAGAAGLSAAFVAVKLAPIGADALAAASAFVKLRVAVASGRAVILGSAAATKLQAIADVEAAAAAAAKTAANIASIEATAAKAIVVAGATDTTFIAAAAETQLTAATVANTAATDALAAAQGRLAVATKAASVQARILSLINPFAFAVAGIAAAGVGIVVLIDKFKEIEELQGRIAAAGDKFALTDFGKVGADIVRVQENLARVQKQIDIDVTTKGFANPTALALAQRYEDQLTRLGVKQNLLASGTAESVSEAEAQIAAMTSLASAVDGVVASIEQENMLLQLNSRERQIQSALLQEIASLEKQSGSTATDEQRASIEAALRRNQALSDQAAAFESIRGPQEAFNAQIEAFTALQAEGRISVEELDAALQSISETVNGVDLTGVGDVGGEGAAQRLRDQLEATRELAQEEARRGRLASEIQGPLAGLQQREADIMALRADGTLTTEQATTALEQNAEAIRLLNPEYAAQAEALRAIEEPNIKLQEDLATLDALLQANRISEQQYRQELEKLGVATETSNTAIEGFQIGLKNAGQRMTDVQGAAQTLAENGFGAAEDALVSFVTTGEADFSAFAEQLLADLARLIIKQLLFNAISGIGGGFAGAFGLGGGAAPEPKADGGPVNANDQLLVGEQGPELFTPATAGNITPAGETAAIMNGSKQQAPVVNVAPPAINIKNVVQEESDADFEDSVINTIQRKRRSVQGILG